MELKDTIDLMNSEDFKDRLKAEYYQLLTRYDKLKKTIVNYELGKLDFEPKGGIELLTVQANHMRSYLVCLEMRAIYEGIEL